MAVTAKKGRGALTLPSGSYLVKIQDVSEVNSDWGRQIEITFKVQGEDHQGEKFSQRFGPVVSEKSYLGAMILAIDDIILDQEEYDIEKYEGKFVGVIVGPSPKSEKGNIRVIGFYPPGKPGRKEEPQKEGKEDDIPI